MVAVESLLGQGRCVKIRIYIYIYNDVTYQVKAVELD